MYWSVSLKNDAIQTFYRGTPKGSYQLIREPYCKVCCSPLQSHNARCNWKQVHPESIDRIYAIGYYIPTGSYHSTQHSDFLSQHIYFVKTNIWKAEPLGLAIAECIRQLYPELLTFEIVTPVPRYKTEYHCDEDSNEPFSPPELICKWVTKDLKMNMVTTLEKTREQKMRDLLLFDRRDKVNGLYNCTYNDVKGTSVLLIDDVSTTGSTLDECSKMLLSAGANKVSGFVCGKDLKE